MKFIVLPMDDAKFIFTEEELSTMRQNVYGTEIIVHEETLIRKRDSMGMSVLPTNDSDNIVWTYPVYEYGTKELAELISSERWMEKD